MGEGFGFYDIRRWKKAPWFVNKQQYGMWASKAEVGSGKLVNLNTKMADAKPLSLKDIFICSTIRSLMVKDIDKYYLYMIPTNNIELNPQLKQNPGW